MAELQYSPEVIGEAMNKDRWGGTCYFSICGAGETTIQKNLESIVYNILKNGHTILHDVGKVTYYNNGDPQERYFLNAAGTGLNEMVCNRTNQLKSQGKGGSVRYMLNTANCLLRFKCVHVQLDIDDQRVFDDEILSLSVGNGKYNGGGMMMMPKAIPNDGLFDITVVKKVGMVKFAASINNIYDGSFVDKLKEVTTYRGKKIRIVSIPAHQLLLETEGETLTNSPFDFEILPSSINMVIPEKTEQLNN